ncbi:MAG: hypothetical protein K6F09_04515 [Clostridiales bacterium]|nr:hypothetical protein [Clostridiales bacterium]
MFKKALSVFLAALVICSFAAIAVSAEATNYKMSEVVSVFNKGKKDVIFVPGDTIELDDTASSQLIITYTYDADDGAKAYSENGFTTFCDLEQTSGYAIKGMGDTVTYADTIDKTDREIDFVSEKEYEFKGWKVKYVYSESNYNKLVVVAVWDVPEAKGWEGFKSTYLKHFVDLLLKYIGEFFLRIGMWF